VGKFKIMRSGPKTVTVVCLGRRDTEDRVDCAYVHKHGAFCVCSEANFSFWYHSADSRHVKEL